MWCCERCALALSRGTCVWGGLGGGEGKSAAESEPIQYTCQQAGCVCRCVCVCVSSGVDISVCGTTVVQKLQQGAVPCLLCNMHVSWPFWSDEEVQYNLLRTSSSSIRNAMNTHAL